jgi:ComF family protein
MTAASVWDPAKTWLEALLGFFYPEICQVCRLDRATAPEGYVCQSCRSGQDGVHRIREPFCARCGLPFAGAITGPFECGNCRELDLYFDYARSAVGARGVVLDVIHRYKYRRAVWFEPFLAELLNRAAVPELACDAWDAIVPVPLHPLKRREREFNQAERLARRLARTTGIPLNTRLLRRVECTRTQTMLSRTERQDNVRGAFALRTAQPLERARIVLVDDVLTTGATTSECARVLKSAGAQKVAVWTLARGLPT